MAPDTTPAFGRHAIWLAAFFAVACGDGSPTAPAPPVSASPTSGFTIVIDDPQSRFAALHDTIRTLTNQTLSAAGSALGIDGVTVLVTADPGRSIPGWGLGGYAPDGSTIEITINPGFPDLPNVLADRLPPILAHELHHNMRWRGPGYGSTLLENMISEGLADHFAIEHLGAEIPPWSNAFPADQTTMFMERARPLFDSGSFDFNAWFFGAGTDLPRWTGYTLGYRLVERFQEQDGRTAADLVHASADLFRPE